MTVHEFNPRFTNEDNWSCSSVDKNSPWCLAISDCLWHYMFRFYNIDCEVKCCEWPLTEYTFNYQKRSKYYKIDFKTYEEYLASNPKVNYYTYVDNQFYSLKNTDGTCDFAYQNNEYVFIIHITSGYYNEPHSEGFGCIINKITNEIHYVALGEDDGNYWGDHDIDYNELNEFEIGYVSSVINEMNDNLFINKESLIEKLFDMSKNHKNAPKSP